MRWWQISIRKKTWIICNSEFLPVNNVYMDFEFCRKKNYIALSNESNASKLLFRLWTRAVFFGRCLPELVTKVNAVKVRHSALVWSYQTVLQLRMLIFLSKECLCNESGTNVPTFSCSFHGVIWSHQNGPFVDGSEKKKKISLWARSITVALPWASPASAFPLTPYTPFFHGNMGWQYFEFHFVSFGNCLKLTRVTHLLPWRPTDASGASRRPAGGGALIAGLEAHGCGRGSASYLPLVHII